MLFMKQKIISSIPVAAQTFPEFINGFGIRNRVKKTQTFEIEFLMGCET